jgi:lipopolysaccharide transport system permease protein
MAIFSKNLSNLSTLIFEMARRDIIGRYKGSTLGLLWSLFNPLFMLAVYTFAFGFIFKAKWPGLNDDPFSFAITLFPALLVFNFFSECASRSPSIIISNPSYVKKVVFPLQVLPLIISLSALFHFLVGFVVWCIAFFVLFGKLYLTILLLPFVLLPLILFSLACSWVLTSLGVYLRDIQQIISVVTSALIFLSPVFYPIESVPENYRSFIMANPLTQYVETIRGIMVFGTIPNFLDWFFSLFLASLLAFIGYWWFAVTRKGFADVI